MTAVLLWGHAAYLVLLAAVVSGCLWTAMRMDGDR
jgi:hypothetical protein